MRTIPKPLKYDESEYAPVMRGRPVKRGATITEVDGSGSDMDLGSPSGSGGAVAGSSNEEEKLMGEIVDKQTMIMDEMMLPSMSRPGGNSIVFICYVTYYLYSQEVGSQGAVPRFSLLGVCQATA